MADSQVGPSWFVPADNTKPEAPASSTGSSGASWFVPADETQKSDPLPPKVKDRFDKTKADFGKALSPHIGIPPGDIYVKADTVAKAVDGPKATPQSFWGKIKNTDSAIGLRHMKDELAGQLMFAKPGYDAVALSRQYQEVKKKLDAIKPEDQLGGFGSTLINMVEGLGYQVRHEAGAVGADVAGFMMGEVWDKALGFEPMTHLLKARQGEADKVFGTISGQTYGDLIDKGIDPKVARGVAAGVGVFNVAAWAVPGGRTPGVQKLLEEATTEGLLKVSLKGVVIGDIAKGVGKQGAYGAIYSTINAISPYVAEAVQKRESLWKAMGTNSGEVLKEIGVGAGLQAVIGGSAEAVGAVVHGSKLAAAIDKAKGEVDAHPEVLPNENVGGASKPGAPKADQFIDEAAKDRQMAAAAKDHVAAMPIGDLDKPIPYEDVPRETTKTGGPVVDPLDKQVAKDPRVVAAKAQVPADSNRVSNIENQVYQEKFTEQHPAVVEAKKALQAALDDPTQADKVASLTEAFQSARKEANMMAAERGTQRVARERARVEGVATRNKYIQDIKDIQAKLPTMNRQFKGPIEDILKDYNTKNPMDSTMTKLKQLRAALSAPDSTVTVDQKLLDRLDEIDKVPLAKLPHEQFKALHDAVMALDKEATNQNTLWVNGKRMDRAVALNDAIAAMPPIKKTAEEWAKTSTRLGNAAEKIHKTTRALAVIGPAHYDTLVNMIGGGERSPVYDILGRQPDHAADTARDLHIRGRHVTADWLEKEKTTPEGYFDEKVTIPGLFEGVNRDVTITKGHLLSAWMHRQWDENWKHFTNGVALKGHLQGGEHLFTPNEAALDKAFADKLTDKDKEFLATHIAHIKEKITPEMQAKFQELNNHDMETPDFYWALNVAKYGKKGRAAVQDIVHQQIDRNDHYMGVNTSHVKPRVDSKAGIYWRPFQEDWASMIKFHSDYVGKATEMRNAAALLNSPEFREQLNKVYGDENTHAALVNGINAISGKRYVPDAYESGWMWLRQQGIKSAMNFNLHAAARNPFLATRSQQYIPYDHWLGGVMQAIRHPKLTHQELMAESSYYEEAGTRGTSQESQTALTRPGKFTKIGMAPEQASIRGTYRMEMTGVKNYAMDTFKKGKPQDSYWEYLQRSSIGAEFPSGIQPSDIPNLTMVQRKFYANQYAEYVAKRTHASPEPQFQSNFVLSGKPLPVMMMTLGSEGNAGWNMVVRGIMDAPHVKGGAVKLGKALFALGVLAPAADIGVKAAFNAATGKKQEPLGQMALEAGLNTVGEMLPGGTAITYPLSKIIEGKHTTQSNIVSQDATDALSAAESFARAAKAKHDRTKTSDFEHGAETTVGMIARLFGFPYWTLRGYAVGAYDIATGQEPKK